MPEAEIQLSQLQNIQVFKDVPKEQLSWLLGKGKCMHLKAGEFIFHKGDPLNKMIVLLKGTLLYQQKQNDGSRTLDEIIEGEVTGALPYSRAKFANAELKIQDDGEALFLSSEWFREMITGHYELTEALVHTMTTRVREFTRSREQSEKMAALGKLSAGLAHELNNPASAVVRSSAELKKQLNKMPQALKILLQEELSPDIFQDLHDLSASKASENNKEPLSLLDKTAAEDKLAEWLKGHELEKPFEIAEILAEFRLKITELEQLGEKLDGRQLKPVLQWFCLLLSMEKLTEEIQHSSGRISQLVNAVKTYSHMDKSPEKEHTNILKGIQDTLTILNFKIRKKSIEVNTDFPEELPKVCVYAGELNQVWTNLLDNAIDAAEKGGKINISVKSQDEAIVVKIQDNGPGIPEEIRKNIFDPFFTTKSLGEGSGLGLDIVKRIVEDHEGSIQLESEAGKTTFIISLPI